MSSSRNCAAFFTLLFPVPFPRLHYQSFCTLLTRTNNLFQFDPIRCYSVLHRQLKATKNPTTIDHPLHPHSLVLLIHTQVSDLICEVKEIKKARFVIWTIPTWLIGWIRVTYSLFLEIVLFPSTPSPLLCPNTASTSIERKDLQKSSYEKLSCENTFTRTPCSLTPIHTPPTKSPPTKSSPAKAPLRVLLHLNSYTYSSCTLPPTHTPPTLNSYTYSSYTLTPTHSATTTKQQHLNKNQQSTHNTIDIQIFLFFYGWVLIHSID
ncbi:hypothetical protein K457DRAFT_468765 [Linnemannia elongata AG-77]|uniref:Uncharacterized protein n=1 Tax=Linnemannia elongata AG-77 TaxID=1314771 RepID=A0A197JZ91_9FUNG|nr:hypothetical protein K457DRAFT_468765 [Linnemannia elongata AG-77]